VSTVEIKHVDLNESMVRAMGGTAATLKVGDRYPLVTSSYSLPAEATTPGFSPAPVINYEDLGLTVKVTPTVHDSTETTLDIDAEFKLLSGASVDGMPIISNRTLKSQARLKFGEWVVVAGLLNSQQARKISGIAGLARVPLLGPLTSVRDNSNEGRQVLILMRPVLITPPASERRPPSFALGSETRPTTAF
jgi:type II secretory pathway component GspD/PulD (secretin)